MLPPEPLTVILVVIDVLEALGIPYFIGESLASAVYGVPRATLDADLVADIRLEQAEPLAQAWHDAFYVDIDAIRDAVRRQSSFNLIHLCTLFKVDIFVPKQRAFDQVQFTRRVPQVFPPSRNAQST